jgi:mannose-6-phosphate isomerase-like protein (cupin superfamily)
MIYKVFPSLNDFENLSRLKVESSDFANTFDYRNLVVNKPWGYEYLWYQNETVAIWFLFIKKLHGTSLHCHARKRTSLIVLDGLIQCNTLDDKYAINPLQAIVLEPCVFHSSKALSENGAYLLEIETPPMKGDLVRMNDLYGRQNAGYENIHQYSTDFSNYEYYPFSNNENSDWNFKGVFSKLTNQLPKTNMQGKLMVPISGLLDINDQSIIDVGEAFSDCLQFSADALSQSDNQFLIFGKELF